MAFKTMKTILLSAATLTGLGATGVAVAAGGGDSNYEMEHKHWHFQGMRGSYDRAAAQRGYQVYREVCSSCHALEHLAFRHLGDKGAPFYDENYPNPNDNPYVKAFAADWEIPSIDSETGDEITKPGVPADNFPAIFPNDAAARASNGGALPPDLSLIVAARNGGADYLYNILVAYSEPMPKGMTMTAGLHYNPVMDGGAIAMAAPLSDGQVDYAPVTLNDHGEMKTIPAPEATVEQMAADVTEFLAWSSDPKMEQRKSAGFATMLYLLILSGLMWVSYQRVWKNVKH
ncbi:MAG: cytochrome c1 [Maricaulaceae bacterium]